MSKVRRIEGVGVYQGEGVYPKAADNVTDVTTAVVRPLYTSNLNTSSSIEFHIKAKPNTQIR